MYMAIFTYPLFERENHLFVQLPEGPFLVDTGSPMSFGTTGSISFGDETVPLRERAGMLGMNISMTTIRKLVTCPCSGLLGMDVLGKHTIRFCLRAGELHIDDVDDANRGTVLASASAMGVPMIGIHSRGTDLRALFDTGAQYGYVLKSELVDGLDVIGNITDYNPMLGDISSDASRLPYQLIGEDGQLASPLMHETVGYLEAGLLSLLNADAIIGWHLLEGVDLVMRPDGGMEVTF
jgi:hypothetical protein